MVDADLSGIPTIEVSATLEDSASRPSSPERVTPVREVSAEREGGGRGEGGGAEASEPRPSRGRVFISWGEESGANEATIRELVSAGVPGTELLLVELRRSHTFVEVQPEAVDPLVNALNGKVHADKPLLVERARRRRRR
jgi:ATP-dependent RNA helicase DeaD